ncbi:MAG: TatD family hydrolase, partial [Nitrospirae bacterium]|nr:TatD family hydrolase [Nitrospirota bacterium]
MRNLAISHQPSAVSLIDTHCHIEMSGFDNDREEVIKRARDAGLEAIITVGSDFKGNLGALELSRKYY